MIHKYKLNGYNIVLDVNSGSVHIVDDVVYDLLGETSLTPVANNNSPQLLEAMQEIQQLIDDGVLYTKTDTSDITYKNSIVKALCLHVAHDCNLSCKYCFACEGEYKGERGLMSAEVGKQAIDFLLANSGNRINLEVDFFGGEPLMNFDVVKQIVEYGRQNQGKKNIRFTLTTNGLGLTDEIIDYINENMENVVLSIDGRKEVNDNMRRLRNGEGSYDVIVTKIKKTADSRFENNKYHYIRGTFTAHNLDFSQDFLHFVKEGFKEISLEPVVASPDKDYAIKREHIEQIKKEYENLANIIIEYRNKGEYISFFHFNVDLEGGPCKVKRANGCGAGVEYLAITPDGDLYPCHQFVGNEDFKIGTLATGVTNTDIGEKFKVCNVETKSDCINCFAKYYCSGGCSANAYEQNGDITSPYEIGCELMKKRVECAIMLKVDELE